MLETIKAKDRDDIPDGKELKLWSRLSKLFADGGWTSPHPCATPRWYEFTERYQIHIADLT
jgi:hypothetical protein